jgi:thiamine monophosphate synthase
VPVRWGHRGDIQLSALSGITGPEEVQRFSAAGVSMVLVGETLMRAADPREAILTLLGQQVSCSRFWQLHTLAVACK